MTSPRRIRLEVTVPGPESRRNVPSGPQSGGFMRQSTMAWKRVMSHVGEIDVDHSIRTVRWRPIPGEGLRPHELINEVLTVIAGDPQAAEWSPGLRRDDVEDAKPTSGGCAAGWRMVTVT